MRALIGTLLAAAAVLTLPTVAEARKKGGPEAELARMLKGRVAGEPVNCIFTPTIRATTIIDRTAIVYDTGQVLYVNRPESGAAFLDSGDFLVSRLTGSQLCRVDLLHLHEGSQGFRNGSVGLGRFVPYRKATSRF